MATQDVDGRDIGEQSDAVLRTARPGHDELEFAYHKPRMRAGLFDDVVGARNQRRRHGEA
jgi:hypothetical protein